MREMRTNPRAPRLLEGVPRLIVAKATLRFLDFVEAAVCARRAILPSSPRYPDLKSEISSPDSDSTPWHSSVISVFSVVKSPRAFTLLELIVVVLVLGVIVGALAPRLGDSSLRRAQQQARDVVGLLSTAARRDAAGGARLALEYQPDEKRLALLVLRAPEPGSRALPSWSIDPLAPPVTLENIRLRDALADGAPLDRRGWRLEFPQNQPRPEIELRLETGDPPRALTAWSVLLLPGASAAALDGLGSNSPRPVLRSIDLDAMGKGAQSW